MRHPLDSRQLQQIGIRRADDLEGPLRALRIIDQSSDEYDRCCQPLHVYGIGGAKLEIVLGTNLGKQSSEMEVPIVESDVAIAHPLAEGDVWLRPISATHRECIEREFEIARYRVNLVVSDAGARVVQRPPKVGSITGVIASLPCVAGRVAEQSDDNRCDRVEQQPSRQRVLSALEV